MKKVASLQYGVIFKKAFSQPDIFTGFVRDILGVHIEIDHVETEKSFDPPIGKIDTRFDLFAEDKKNRVVVDIQHVRFPDHYDRFLHYHCVALLEQVARSELYTPTLRTFTIVVLTSGDKHKVDVATIDFDPKDRQGKGLNEILHRVVYLCPKYVTAETPPPYREWLQAINDSLDQEVEESSYQLPEIQRVFNLIEQDLVSPQERARMKDEYAMELVKRDKYEEGWQDGREEGQAQGREEERRRLAHQMLSQGLEVKLITELTNLTLEEIQQWGQAE
jgi:predicted transposase/invertase (TIGR01784 family)